MKVPPKLISINFAKLLEDINRLHISLEQTGSFVNGKYQVVNDNKD